MKRITDKENQGSKVKKICYGIGAIALTAAGVIAVPPLIKKFSNKMYKKSAESEEIDIENLGPTIVKKSDDQKEELK